MKTTFRVTQMQEVPCNDVHTVEDFAISRFGTSEVPSYVQVEIISQEEDDPAEDPAEDPSAPVDQVNATSAESKAEDEQQATDIVA